MTDGEQNLLLKEEVDHNLSYGSITGKKWQEKRYDIAKAFHYSTVLNANNLLAQILVNRTETIEEAISFLNPKIKNLLPDPFSIADMEKSCEKLCDALEKGEKIVIFGDYDVDGAVSSALLKNFFNALGVEVGVYIPNRFTDGYGPSVAVFNKLINEGAQLIITVDCGSMAFEAMEYASSRNVDVIVTDHHQVVENLPNCFAVINPNRMDDKSGLGYLAGCGVAFMFAVGICKKLKERDSNFTPPDLMNSLDLVALGTVCDVVPLVSLNRAFVKQGLKVMQNSQNKGLNYMLHKLQKDNEVDTFTLGFILGPRINAGGRVGESDLGSKLLTSSDSEEIEKLYNRLHELNEERKKIELNIFEEAIEMAENQNNNVIIVSSDNWHQGIIGIVASRIKDKFSRPAIVIAFENGVGKGSSRSVNGFDIGGHIIEAVNKGLIESGGGHKAAAGLVIKKEQLSEFHVWLNEAYEKAKHDIARQNIQFFDGIILPELINDEFYFTLSQLKPFGVSNESPKFLIQDVRISSVKIFAENNLSFQIVSKTGKIIRAKAFRINNSSLGEYIVNNLYKSFDFIVSLKRNDFFSNNKVEIIIEDLIVSKNCNFS